MKRTILILAVITFFTLNSQAQNTGSISNPSPATSQCKGTSWCTTSTLQAATCYQLSVSLQKLSDSVNNNTNDIGNSIAPDSTPSNITLTYPISVDDHDPSLSTHTIDEEITDTKITYTKLNVPIPNMDILEIFLLQVYYNTARNEISNQSKLSLKTQLKK